MVLKFGEVNTNEELKIDIGNGFCYIFKGLMIKNLNQEPYYDTELVIKAQHWEAQTENHLESEQKFIETFDEA